MVEQPISNLIINKVENQSVYDYMLENNLVNSDELYLVSDSENGGVTSVNGQTGDVTLTIPTVTDTYSADSTEAMSGKAIASALENAGKVKTVNNVEPDVNGNISLDIDDGAILTTEVDSLFEDDVVGEDEVAEYYTKSESDLLFVKTIEGQTPDENGNVALYRTFTIVQSDPNQTIKLDCNGATYTSTCKLLLGSNFTVTVTPKYSHIGGTPSVASGVVSEDTTITATEATLKTFNLSVSTYKAHTAQEVVVYYKDITDGTVHKLQQGEEATLPYATPYTVWVNSTDSEYVSQHQEPSNVTDWNILLSYAAYAYGDDILTTDLNVMVTTVCVRTLQYTASITNSYLEYNVIAFNLSDNSYHNIDNSSLLRSFKPDDKIVLLAYSKDTLFTVNASSTEYKDTKVILNSDSGNQIGLAVPKDSELFERFNQDGYLGNALSAYDATEVALLFPTQAGLYDWETGIFNFNGYEFPYAYLTHDVQSISNLLISKYFTAVTYTEVSLRARNTYVEQQVCVYAPEIYNGYITSSLESTPLYNIKRTSLAKGKRIYFHVIGYDVTKPSSGWHLTATINETAVNSYNTPHIDGVNVGYDNGYLYVEPNGASYINIIITSVEKEFPIQIGSYHGSDIGTILSSDLTDSTDAYGYIKDVTGSITDDSYFGNALYIKAIVSYLKNDVVHSRIYFNDIISYDIAASINEIIIQHEDGNITRCNVEFSMACNYIDLIEVGGSIYNDFDIFYSSDNNVSVIFNLQ